jgi:hypothetical protein
MKALIVGKLVQLTKYRQVGGLHFLRLGRLGFSFYIARQQQSQTQSRQQELFG